MRTPAGRMTVHLADVWNQATSQLLCKRYVAGFELLQLKAFAFGHAVLSEEFDPGSE